jgi:hypothetical protein
MERPLTYQQQREISVNMNILTLYIDCREELVAEMYSVDCITERQKQLIQTEPVMSRRNQRLLDIIKLKSIHNFNKFLDCLNRTKQQYVGKLLTGEAGRTTVLYVRIGYDEYDIF